MNLPSHSGIRPNLHPPSPFGKGGKRNQLPNRAEHVATLLTARVFWLFLLKFFNCSFLSTDDQERSMARTSPLIVNPGVIRSHTMTTREQNIFV